MPDRAIRAARCDKLQRISGADAPEGTFFVEPNRESERVLSSLDEVQRYIESIDFADLKAKMRSREGNGWDDERIDRAERLYKRWLFLRAKYRDELMPPTEDIDEFWHYHILDTNSYFEDCEKVFGGYFHHFPYFGMRGPDDEALLNDAFTNTLHRYESEYGESLLSDGDASPRL